MNPAVGESFNIRKQLEEELIKKEALIQSASTALKKARAEAFQYRQPMDTLFRRKTAELQRIKSHAAQEKSDNTDFIMELSADLLGPMEEILSSVQKGVANIESMDRSALKKSFEKIQQNTIAIQTRLNDVNKLSELDAGKTSYHFKNAPISELVQKVIDEFSVRSKKKDVDITFCTASFDDTVEVDQDQIILVIRNLVANAIEHATEGGTVTLEICDRKRNLSFSVFDNGYGAGEDDLDCVFNKFIPRNDIISYSSDLALAITKEIIVDHFGEIWAEKNPDGGTILSFIIPKKREI
ncbi:MAG: HAMP domain-containing histidine kinase [Proteobacteria bacterium]|nr:HAMP domain-containing histidine kinase [Pseudomonadota bacterium]